MRSNLINVAYLNVTIFESVLMSSFWDIYVLNNCVADRVVEDKVTFGDVENFEMFVFSALIFFLMQQKLFANTNILNQQRKALIFLKLKIQNQSLK